MSRLIDADKLELDSEWNDYYDGYMAYSQCQVDCAETVKAIPVDKINKAIKEMDTLTYHLGSYDQVSIVDRCIEILKKNLGDDFQITLDRDREE
jgi:hypothetical protein